MMLNQHKQTRPLHLSPLGRGRIARLRAPGEGEPPSIQSRRPPPAVSLALAGDLSPTEIGFTRFRHSKKDRNRQQPISIGRGEESAGASISSESGLTRPWTRTSIPMP